MKICPKCKSENVNIKITVTSAIGAPQPWVCHDCGFESYAPFPDKEEEEIRK